MTIEAIPDDQPTPLTPSQSFADFLPEDATHFSGTIGISDDGTEAVITDDSATFVEPPTPKKRVKMSPKMKKAMDRFTKQLADFPALYFHRMAMQNPEWELDESERDMLSDSITMVLETLNIGFEIEPVDLTLKSIWWIVSWPFVVFAYVFLTKKEKIGMKGDNDNIS